MRKLLTWTLPWYVRAPLAIGLVVLAFFAGKTTAPIEVQEVRSVEVKWKEKISKTDHTAKIKTRIVYVDRVILPDGTVKEKSETRESESALTDSTRLVDRSGESKESSSKTTTLRPNWRVSILAGASLTPPAIPISGPLVLGAQAEFRIVGGLWVGAWGITSGAAGVLVSLEIPK